MEAVEESRGIDKGIGTEMLMEKAGGEHLEGNRFVSCLSVVLQNLN
jgi:hypothetical protein